MVDVADVLLTIALFALLALVLLDPAISRAYARLQAPRVARERGLPVDRVEQLIRDHTAERLGFLGEPAGNVLLLNVDLDQIAPVRT